MVTIQPVSETHLMIYVGEVIDLALTPVIRDLVTFLHHFPEPGIIEVIPSYTSVLVQYHPNQLTYAQLVEAIEAYAVTYQQGKASTLGSGNRITLPVYYGSDVGLDLQAVAEHAGLSVEEVIAIHSGQTYTVCAIGFAPGFAFLASVDARIAMPRQNTPRQCVPAGSVGIANQQTAVYPNTSPGGWQIIGNCPVRLFSPDATPMTPFTVGDTVQFTPIDREQFLQQGGELWPH